MARATKGTEALLMWCKKNSEGYKDVNVKDFHLSWRDGLAFCALIHKFRPELIPFNTLSKENCSHNLDLAFRVGDEIGIPALLEVEDMLIEPRPDTFSVITYLSQYYHFFTKPANVTAKGTGSGVATITFDPSAAKPSVDPVALAKENERLQKENERRIAENEKIRKENERRTAENEKRLREWNARNSPNLQGGGPNTTSGLAPKGSLGACVVCNQDLSGNIIEFSSKSFHQDCFKCHSCSRAFANVQGTIQAICVEGWPYCERCGKIAFVKSRSRPPASPGVKVEEERKRQEDERKRKLEEERKKQEDDRKKEEERKRQEDERKRKVDEDRKKQEIERQKQEEERRRKQEQDNKRQEDERKRLEDRKKEEDKVRVEEDYRRKQDEKKAQEEEERKRKQEEERKRKQEEDKRRQEEDKRKQDEMRQRQEEQRRKQQEDERKRQEEVEKKRKEDEVQRRELDDKRRKEAEDKRQKELDEKRKQEEEKKEIERKRMDEERKQAAEFRKKQEEERKRKANEDKQQAEIDRKKLEDVRKKKEEEEQKREEKNRRETEERERKQKEETERQISPRKEKDDRIKRITEMFENPTTANTTTTSTTNNRPVTTKPKEKVEIKEEKHEALPMPTPTPTFTLKPSPTSIYVSPPANNTHNNNNNNNNNNKLNNNVNNGKGEETTEERLKRMAEERAKRFRESEERARKVQEERERKAKEDRQTAKLTPKPPTAAKDVTPTKPQFHFTTPATSPISPATSTSTSEYSTPNSTYSTPTSDLPRSNSGKKPLPPSPFTPTTSTSPSNSFLTPTSNVQSTSSSPSNSFLTPTSNVQSTSTSPSNSFLTPTSNVESTITSPSDSFLTPTSEANTSSNSLLSPASPSPNRRRNMTASIDRTKKGGSQLNVQHSVHVNTGQNEVGLAEYDFVAEEENELTFHVGDQIELLASHRDSEWAEGRVVRTGQVGWFLPELTNLYYEKIRGSMASDQFLRESVRSAVVLSPSGPELLPMLQEAALDFSFIPTCDGYLLKQKHTGGLFKGWQRRWFSLQEDQIVYYMEEQEKFMTGKESPPYGLIYLRFVRSVVPTADQRFVINTPERSYCLQADSDNDRDHLVMKRLQTAPSNSDRKPQKKEGWLRKLGRFGKFKRRWVVVQGGVVFWYKSRGSSQVGKIPLYHAFKPDEQSYSFTVTSPTDHSRTTFQAEADERCTCGSMQFNIKRL